MSFALLYPRVDWTYNLQATGVFADISGVSSIVVGPSDEVYFAFSAKGTVGSLTEVSTYQIILGCVSATGILQWLFRDPQLVSNSTDSTPSLVLGTAGELYVGFKTVGAVPGKINGLNAPSFCGGCGVYQGPEDIVVARINSAVAGTPVVAWVVQDLSINSCSNESLPRLVYDSYSNRLLITYISSGAIICASRVGSPNVIVISLDPGTGGLSWAYQSNEMNSIGQNTAPSVTTDPTGSIYVAYTTTAQVLGGGTFVGSQCVEVIKITPTGSPLTINRDWILSSVSNINPTTSSINETPYIVYDSSKNRLFLTFITDGTVPGGNKLPLVTNSIVFASINPTSGALNWLRQEPFYNEGTYRYSSIANPVLTIDPNGVPYVVARAIQASTGQGMIFMYRLDPESGATGWIYYDGLITYRAYLPAINSGETPNTAYRAGANYAEPWIAIRSGNLYVGFVNQDTETFQLVGLRQVQRFQDITAYEYMRDYTGICG